MSIRESIEIAHLTLAHSIVLPTPAACQALLQRAQEDGMKIGRLFIVQRPLHPGLRGGYERSTGDIWCHYWAAEPEADRLLLQSLLVLLAHIHLNQPIPTTIDEDWQYEQEAWQTASDLAGQWEMPALLPESELEQKLRENEQLHDWHQAAGELAGSLDPSLARAAYQALAEIRRQHGWNEEQFEAALFGYHEQEEENAAVLAFDRTVLRATWSIPYRAKREGPPFGNLTLIQQSRRTVSLLRSALVACAERRTPPVSLRKTERGWGDDPLHLFFLRIDSDLEFPSLIACCNSWLIEEAPSLAAEAIWWIYSSGMMRIYRLRVRYKPSGNETPVSVPAARELRILFSSDERGRMTEAAFQRYILCWLSVQEVLCETLEAGLPVLWGWLNQEETTGDE